MSVEIHNDSIAGMFNLLAHLETSFLQIISANGSKAITNLLMLGVSRCWIPRTSKSFQRNYRLILQRFPKKETIPKQIRFYLESHRRSKRRDVLLVDDIVDTGGSVVSSIQELKKQGAKNITIACVHPLMNGDCWKSSNWYTKNLFLRVGTLTWRERALLNTKIHRLGIQLIRLEN